MVVPAPNPTRQLGQSTDTVVMVRPASFAPNDETRPSNAFQADAANDPMDSNPLDEFDSVAERLRAEGVSVVLVDDEPSPPKPDAIFPNNWFTTHADGSIVLYPMCAANRRAERRVDLLRHLDALGYRCSHLVDLSSHEIDGRFLEGTGSMVLDRVSHVAFACRSVRTDGALLELWARELGHRTVIFDAVDRAARPIYHTNVMLAIGTGWALVCSESIRDPGERAAVLAELAAGGREVIELSFAQMEGFGGNVLELIGHGGSPIIVMSARARGALGGEVERRLSRHARLVDVAIPSIEAIGGGSVRCMLAEVFLPRGAHQ